MQVTVRELAPSDLPLLNLWRNDAQLVADMGANFQFVAPVVDDRWYQHYLSHRHEAIRLAIDVPVESGPGGNQPVVMQTVGTVNLTQIHPINRTAELSVFIGDAAMRGKGIGHVASWLMLSHAFQQLNLNRVHLQVLAHNQAAIKLYQRLGFSHEGTQRQAVFIQGAYADMLTMSMLRSEFNPQPQVHTIHD